MINIRSISKLFLFLAIGVFEAVGQGSVGIGTSTPNSSSILDLSSSAKGLLVPRMTLKQRNNIEEAAEGLLIYQTNETAGFYFFNGSAWSLISATQANSITTANPDNWSLVGNSGTNAVSNFIGTTDNVPLIFKTNNTFSGKIDPNGDTYFGIASGANSTGFSGNVAFGGNTLTSNTTGTNNTAVGLNSLRKNTTGSSNVAIGINSLNNNLSGTENIGIGGYALVSNTNGINNSAIGGYSLALNSTGNDNSAMGYYSLFSNTIGSYNVGLGTNSLRNNTIGSSNLGIGAFSLVNNINGNFNSGLGVYALALNTSGSNNASIGYYSMFYNTIGENNVAVGTNSLLNNSTGNNNIAIGVNSLSLGTAGSNNIAIGNGAGQNESGSNKLYIANSNTENPLIKGDFAANTLKVNSKTTGYLAVGDFDADTPMPTPTGYRLIVQDGILTEKVKVAVKTTGDWADYVFEEDYKLLPLTEVEKFTKEFNHLPNVPSAQDMAEGGLDIGETSKMFMEKIEELTLYMIKLNKEVEQLKLENVELKALLNK